MGNNTSYQDILKNSFLKISRASSLTLFDIIFVLLITFVMGLFIFFVYRKTFRGVFYTTSFNLSLILLAIVTAMIIMAVRSNIILSLGMVGALSIVRFRTAIKDPIDTIYMFWAISIGITNGAGFFRISIAGSLLIAVMLFSFYHFNIFRSSAPYLLVCNIEPGLVDDVMKAIQSHFKIHINSKVLTPNNVECTIETRLKDAVSDMTKIQGIPGIKDATFVSYEGEKAV